ncbi:hypothetical protein [Phenylobacterium sp.]|uniref:hypothetical protein n=1 Tax=Phenylobacterium sp. TaxID=1871053 RepID=UPI002F4045B0
MSLSLGSTVEILWWAFFATLLAAFALRSLRDGLARRARRRRAKNESSIAPVVRRFEEEQLARMEADGVTLWRPDPAKLKRISERQD